jgi:HPt (histidine-containing phosphotransfer) domain-containing protein
MSHPELLNPKVIEQIIRDTSIEVLDPLLSAFISELEKHQAQLINAFKEQAILQIVAEAHALKSCSGTFGAQALYEHSMALEDKAKLTEASIAALNNDINLVLDTITVTRQHYQTYDFSEIKNTVIA